MIDKNLFAAVAFALAISAAARWANGKNLGA